MPHPGDPAHRVRFITAAALVSELIEARDEKRLLRFQKQLAAYELIILDELDYVPMSKSGAEMLFEIISQRYERSSTLLTSNLPFDEWTELFGSERQTVQSERRKVIPAGPFRDCYETLYSAPRLCQSNF